MQKQEKTNALFRKTFREDLAFRLGFQIEWRVERTIINTVERGVFWFWLCRLL